jgi:ribosome-associated protein
MKAKITLKPKKKEEHFESIPISTEFIKLDAFLKFANIAETGGDAKLMVEDGIVTVNGETCTQRGKKLRPGDKITVDGEGYMVTSETDGN